jgi:hypothetical protein
MLTVSSTGCGQLVHTVRSNDLPQKTLRTSREYGPKRQHLPLETHAETVGVQRFARVHGRHKEQPPQKSLALSTFSDQLVLPEDGSHTSSGDRVTRWIENVPLNHDVGLDPNVHMSRGHDLANSRMDDTPFGHDIESDPDLPMSRGQSSANSWLNDVPSNHEGSTSHHEGSTSHHEGSTSHHDDSNSCHSEAGLAVDWVSNWVDPGLSVLIGQPLIRPLGLN